MSSSMSTILLIGGTSGIGESFARRWHTAGKKVIITGRRQDRLASLASALPGLETHKMDNSDLAALPGHIDELFRKHPAIDTVLVNSGTMELSNIRDIESSSDEKVMKEVQVNVTAPMIIARHVLPRLLSRGSESTFMITGSGLGFVPMSFSPVYCATKAAVHSYMVALRQSMQGSNVNIIEIVPPAVKTDLEPSGFIAKFPHMTLEEYTEETFGILDGRAASELKEVAAGTAVPRVEAWRGSIGKILEERKLGG